MTLRWLYALLIALAVHGLILLLPLPGKDNMPPRLPGWQAIHVSLAGTGQTEKTRADDIQTARQSPHPFPVPAVRRTLPVPVQERTNTPEIPLPEQRKLQHIQPAGRKKRPERQLQSPTAVHERSKAKETAEKEISVSPTPNNRGEQRTASPSPAVVKASPLYTANPKPPYPPLARRRGWQGTVLLKILVSAQGRPEKVSVSRSSNFPLLDKTALIAVKGWRFQPGTRGGRPVAMEVLVPVHFRLD